MTSFFDYLIDYTVSVHIEAQSLMDELLTFEGGENLVGKYEEPTSATHGAWVRGTNTASGGNRSMRIIMRLHMAVEILRRCDMKIFAETGAVECRPNGLRNPAQNVCF